KRFFKKLVKSSSTQSDHERAFWLGMKDRAGCDGCCVGNDQSGRIGEINRRFAIEFAAPKAAHLHDRSGLLDRDVIVRRLERQRTYLSKTGLAGRGEDCEGCEYKTNHSKNWIAAEEIHQT